jgi:hypothetical protein
MEDNVHENGIKISALFFAIACALAFVTDATRAQGPASSNDPFAAFSDSLTAVPSASTLNNRGQFYVPVFSSIRMGGGRTRLDLAVTLSIHNASNTEVLVLERVDYFNTAGILIQSYLARPIAGGHMERSKCLLLQMMFEAAPEPTFSLAGRPPGLSPSL